VPNQPCGGRTFVPVGGGGGAGSVQRGGALETGQRQSRAAAWVGRERVRARLKFPAVGDFTRLPIDATRYR
jgi:hypothetical protein